MLAGSFKIFFIWSCIFICIKWFRAIYCKRKKITIIFSNGLQICIVFYFWRKRTFYVCSTRHIYIIRDLAKHAHAMHAHTAHTHVMYTNAVYSFAVQSMFYICINNMIAATIITKLVFVDLHRDVISIIRVGISPKCIWRTNCHNFNSNMSTAAVGLEQIFFRLTSTCQS